MILEHITYNADRGIYWIFTEVYRAQGYCFYFYHLICDVQIIIMQLLLYYKRNWELPW